MVEPRACVQLEIDSSKYSSFVPVIGVYIAGTSVVCFLAMLYDILLAIRHKRTWIPCKLFSLNSLTLTLLAIAAKLPVDLTSPMPSALDQVSKLSGNSLVCICMGFLMPSLGLKQRHDCLTNMLALSIFVVTLVVNTCIQIRTGVIFLFIAPHVITMCCMLAMLCPLWLSFTFVAKPRVSSYENCKQVLGESEGRMIERLKLAYIAGVDNDPQFVVFSLSKVVENYTVAGLSMISLVSLMQPAIRNFSLEFCGGNSDYGKSVWVIVLVQILTVLAGSLATMVRAFGLPSRMQIRWNLKFTKTEDKFGTPLNYSFIMNIGHWCTNLLKAILLCGSWMLFVLVCVPVGAVFKGLGLLFRSKLENSEGQTTSWRAEGLKHLIDSREVKSWKYMSELFRRNEAVIHRPLIPMSLEIGMSTHSVAVLVRIARVLLPPEQSAPLVQAHREVYEIFGLVDFVMKSTTQENKRKSNRAEALRRDSDGNTTLKLPQFSQDIQLGVILKELRFKLGPIYDNRVVARRLLEYIEQVYCRDTEFSLLDLIQEMFRAMLIVCLCELPNIVYKYVMESDPENLFERLRTSLGIFCDIELLETNINWFLPKKQGIRKRSRYEIYLANLSHYERYVHVVYALPPYVDDVILGT